MEYKIVKNNANDFWEDKKINSFGLDKKIIVKIDKNLVTIESSRGEVFLYRDNKKAKISTEGRTTKGVVKNNDKMYLNDEVVIEFFEQAKLRVIINWNLWIGITVLLLIVVTIFFGWKKTSETKEENNYQKILSEIKSKIVSSDETKSIDPETSLKLLNEAKNKVLEIKNNKRHLDEVDEIGKVIDEKLALGGSIDVVGFSEIYNTKSADATDRIYDKMVMVGNEAVLAESKTGKIILVNLDLKNVTKFDVGQEITGLIYYNKKIYYYDGQNIFDTAKNKVAEAGATVYSKIINWNNSWYLLGQEGKIRKLVDNKISDWTKEGASLIDKPVDMTIDGTVWVIDASGNIKNYERGSDKQWKSLFKIGNEKIQNISTTIESTKIAIASDKKVYVLEKSGGKLLATYNFEKVGIIETKMGSKDQIFILAKDQKIYKVK